MHNLGFQGFIVLTNESLHKKEQGDRRSPCSFFAYEEDLKPPCHSLANDKKFARDRQIELSRRIKRANGWLQVPPPPRGLRIMFRRA